jgi:cell division protein FtsW (lipid II flippase)
MASRNPGNLWSLGSVLALWALMVALGWWLIQAAPAVRMLERVEVTLPKGGEVTLGRASLGLPAWERGVALDHLGVRRDAEGGWQFANRSTQRKVDLALSGEGGGRSLFPKRWRLARGDGVRLGQRVLQVERADDQAGILILSDDLGDRVTWQAGRLSSERWQTWPHCRYGADGLGQLRSGLRNLARELRWRWRGLRSNRAQPLFALGGGVQCGDRWRLAGVELGAARVLWQGGEFWIDAASETRIAYRRAGEERWRRGTELWRPLVQAGLRADRVILGRIWFGLEFGDERLTLTPLRNLPVAFPSGGEAELATATVPGVTLVQREAQWIGAGAITPPSLRAWILGAAILLASLLFALLVGAIRRQRGGRDTTLAIWLKVLPGWLLLWLGLALWGAISANLAWALAACALAWLLATLQLWGRGRLQGAGAMLWAIALGLAGIGALVLAQLAAGAENTRWLGFATGQLRILTLTAGLVALAAWLPIESWRILVKRSFDDRRWFGGLKALGLLAVVALLAGQFLIGDERGLGWMQPVEFAKFVMLLLLASALTHLHWLRRMDSRDYRRNRHTRLLAALSLAGAFGFGAAFVMLGVHDNSPLVILALVLLPMIWIGIPDPVVPRMARIALWRTLLVALPLLMVIGAASWLWFHPPDYLSSLPQADRFRVWSDPLANRFSGEQLLQSLARVQEGGWHGVSSWFGRNGKVMNLPAVQDDFIAAFLLHRFGGLFGLLLVLLQGLWWALLIQLGRGLMTAHGGREEERGLFRLGALLFGLAWIQAAHWVISWGNVTGLLPVMGQPMTWLSSGNSHMLAIGVSALLLGLVGAWVGNVDNGAG